VKKLHTTLAAALVGAAVSFGAAAQSQHHGHGTATAAPAKAATAEMTEGEVRKIDKDGKRITLRHAPIKNLDMPSMTMVFVAADPSLLDRVKVGDKVRFTATNPGGKLTVTDIQPAQ
jgi:Cu(I)/Ag(I) efflux system periplasmic protein CusF